MTTARVLLVEDDPSIRRFVALALRSLPIQLAEAGSLEEARRAWSASHFDLLITDLMLPDGTGLQLLESLALAPWFPGGTRTVLFSAGVSPAVRGRAAEIGVWRVLEKPATLTQLVSCVTQALDLPLPARRRRPGTPDADEATARARAVAAHFGGDLLLYDAFRASSLLQFADDIEAGDRACRTGDTPGLHRLAHSLKTVLLLLGADEASAEAVKLERAAALADGTRELQPLWEATRAGLARLR